MKVLYFLSSLPLFATFVLKRHVIGLWPYAPKYSPAVSLNTNTLQFSSGTQEGRRVRSNRVAPMIPHRPAQPQTCVLGLGALIFPLL